MEEATENRESQQRSARSTNSAFSPLREGFPIRRCCCPGYHDCTRDGRVAACVDEGHSWWRSWKNKGKGGTEKASVGLADTVPKPLTRGPESVEVDGQRLILLEAAMQQRYYSLETSGSNCACALHGAFGVMCQEGQVFLPDARRVGAEIIEHIISSQEPRHRVMRSNLADLIQKELAEPTQMDAFAGMFWKTSTPALKTKMREHRNLFEQKRQRVAAVKREICECARAACASDESGFLLTERLGNVNM